MLELTLEILIDIFILDLFDQNPTQKNKAKILVIIVLSWGFKTDQIQKVLNFLISCLPSYKLAYQNYNLINKRRKNIINASKKLRVLKKETKLILIGIAFAVLVKYYSLFNSSDLETNRNELRYIPTPIEKVIPKNKFNLFLSFHTKKKNLMIEDIKQARSQQPKRLKKFSPHHFDKSKRLRIINPRQIPLSERTTTLEKLNKNIARKRFEKLQKTRRLQIIMTNKTLDHLKLICNRETPEFEISIPKKTKFSQTSYKLNNSALNIKQMKQNNKIYDVVIVTGSRLSVFENYNNN